MRILALFIYILTVCAQPLAAETPKRYASIVVDADTLEILHARQIDGQRFPASLTKVMTLYLTFDALNAGTLNINEDLTVSKNAASTPPVKLGLRAGQKVSVNTLVQALTVRSSNDAAVVLAERLGGSEENFAAMMTAKAQELGMQKTVFKNPHGLPDPDQTTTARDMAKLASSILRNHKRYYHYFGQKKFSWKGQTRKNTNNLLHWLNGVDGFKTGYTRDSGYNLIISAQREERRIIAVVLGGASGKSRNTHMQDLIERGFDAIGVAPIVSTPPVAVAKAPVPKKTKTEPVKYAEAVRLRGRDRQPLTVVSGSADIKVASRTQDTAWSIQIGTFRDKPSAMSQLHALTTMSSHGLGQSNARLLPLQYGPNALFRARFTGLSAAQAEGACQALKNLASGCLVIAPG